MSATAFLQFLHQVHADPSLPVFTNSLPSLERLLQSAWPSSFVFAFHTLPAERDGSCPSQSASRGAPLWQPRPCCAPAASVDDFLRDVLRVDWPMRDAASGLPLLEVSTCVLATAAIGDVAPEEEEQQGGAMDSTRGSQHAAHTVYLVASRYEIASTVFALERYTLLGVPADPRAGSGANVFYASGLSEAAGGPEAVAHGEEVVSPAAALAALSFRQRQQTRVLWTVCRAISTAGGAVPDGVTAARHLLSLSLSAAAATAAAATTTTTTATSSAASLRGLFTRFHGFLHSAVPFLGADERRRQRAWELLHEAPPIASDRGASPRNLFHGDFSPDGDRERAKSVTNTTLASNTSAMSEQGQTPGESSRQPSHPPSHPSRQHQHQHQQRGAASVNSSVASCEVANAYAPHAMNVSNGSSSSSGGVQVRWGPSSSSVSGGGSVRDANLAESGPAAATGPVGVTPLPTVNRAAGDSARLGIPTVPHVGSTSAAETEEDAGRSPAAAGAVPDDMCAKVYAECGAYLSPPALSQRRSHLHWQLDAVESLFAACPPYSHNAAALDAEDALTVTEGWQRWAAACSGGLSRPLIVNSMDDIVAYCECSRQAFFSAVAMLDYFVVRTAVSPEGACLGFMNFVRASRYRQQQSQASGGGCCGGKERPVFGPGCPGYLTWVSDKDISAFFTQVICVCCMLGCKMKDTYPPLLKKLLACLNSNNSGNDGSGDGGAFTDVEFTLMEVFVLQRVFHFMHLSEMTTVNEVVDLLLFLVGGDTVKELAEFNFYARLLKRRGAESDWLDAQVPLRIHRAEAGLRRSRHDYLDSIDLAMAHERRQTRRLRRAAETRRAAGARGVSANEEDFEGDSATCLGAMGCADGVGDLPECAQWQRDGARPVPVNKEEVREWHRLSLLARFLSDLAVRGPKSSGSEVSVLVNEMMMQEQPLKTRSSVADPQSMRAELERQVSIRLQCGALEVSPCALGVAVLAVTAEVLRVPLPPPLFAILPASYQRRLKQSGLAPPSHAQGSRSSPANRDAAENEESLLTAPSASPSSAAGAAGGPAGPTRSSSGGCFPVKPQDDLYLVLTHFCATFARNQQQMQQQQRSSEGEDAREAAASMDLQKALDEVHKIYHESRDGGPCDPILRKRYRDMLSM